MKTRTNFLNVFKLIWKISNTKDKFTLIGLFFLSLLRTFSELLPAMITAIIIARINGTSYSIFGITLYFNLSIMSLVIIAFASLFSLTIIASIIRAIIKLFGSRLMGKMNVYAVDNLLSMKNENSKYTNGEISYIIKNSAENIPTFLETFYVRFFVPIITIVLTMIYIASINIISFLIVLATMVVLMIIVFYRVYRNKILLSKLEFVNGKINNNLLNEIDNISLINFFNTKSHELKIIQKLNSQYYKHDKRKNIVYILYWVFVFIAEFICSILVIYFAIQTIETSLLPSVIILLIPYLLKIYTSTENLGFIIVELQQSAIKILRINNMIENKKEDYLVQNISTLPSKESIHKIKVNNFIKKFDSFVCRADDVTFEKGKINCVVGSSGSGKTTLIKGILGIINYDEAIITVNDKYNVENLSSESDRISLAFQDECFFDRKIVENIMYPDNKLNDKALYLIKYFGLDELIERDEKENIENSSFKSKFSGGEKKRMAITRALSKDAEIYVLDEPTNELDKKNVKKVIDYLQKIKKDCMIIVISHDSRIVEISDNIIALN